MKLFWATAAAIFGVCLATCTDETRAQRRAWHTLTDSEKKAYIDAELCLMKKPATLGLPHATNRHEELQVTHQLQAYRTHYVGGFLPFHRALISAHEQALRTECGYEGHQPYWYEQIDAVEFGTSGIFDTKTGFGGNGSEPDNCIMDGPFAGYVNHVGPYYNYTTHCIERIFDETAMRFSAQANVDACMSKPDWLSVWPCLEDLPHKGGHGGVGGLMRDSISSPGDPLFYLHHSWLDYLWHRWQTLDSPKRLKEMGGNNVQSEATLPATWPPKPDSIPTPIGADGDPGNITTIDHVLNMMGNGVNRTVGDTMDIRYGVLCFEYVEPDT